MTRQIHRKHQKSVDKLYVIYRRISESVDNYRQISEFVSNYRRI